MTPADMSHQPSSTARFFWFISCLCAVFGGLVGIAGVMTAAGAPQEAAAAAVGCLIAIAPYVLARSVAEMSIGPAVDWKPLVMIVGVVAALVAAMVGVAQILPMLIPTSSYAAFQDKEAAWHLRCDAAVKDPATSGTCQQDYEVLMADGRAKGWRK